MTATLRLMACLAHPDDESLGVGGTLLHYAEQGVETSIITATFGDRGRYKGIRAGEGEGHPGGAELARIRERELHAAAEKLKIRNVVTLGLPDGGLDQVDPRAVIARIAAEIRRLRPEVVLTFPQDGSYGHPDHIAICQFTTAAIVSAASPGGASDPPPHAVSKLYYMAWAQPSLDAYRESAGMPQMTVDGVTRSARGWPEWMISCRLDTFRYWPAVWEAVLCHESQSASWAGLARLSEEQRGLIWGTDTYYRVFSRVNGGRALETDLFEGLRTP